MNTKVEEALGVIDSAAYCTDERVPGPSGMEIRQARTTLATHIAGQKNALVVALEKQVELLDCIAQLTEQLAERDATIAGLREVLFDAETALMGLNVAVDEWPRPMITAALNAAHGEKK